MKRKKRILSIIGAVAVMILLILDTDTAKNGAAEGIDLCIKAIIPSLFPFFIVSTYLNGAILGLRIPGLRSLGKILHIPAGGESLLLLGLIGGYPVGAQLIGDTYRRGQMDRTTAKILLGYCSNAGPAFIFGITGALFSSLWIPFILWGIHISSSILTGILLPRPKQTVLILKESAEISLVEALKKSIKFCASVCGWIITFKIMIAYLVRLSFVSECKMAHIILSGLLELSNGCINLKEIPSETTRFILCAVFLAFGGICVVLQTMSVTEPLGFGLYPFGKIIQSCISLLTAILLSWILFPENNSFHVLHGVLFILSLTIILILKRRAEKSCGNPENIHV